MYRTSFSQWLRFRCFLQHTRYQHDLVDQLQNYDIVVEKDTRAIFLILTGILMLVEAADVHPNEQLIEKIWT